MRVTITGSVEAPVADCERILRALPDWFGIESALVQYVRDLAEMPCFAARAGEVVGFVAIRRHFARAAEVHVMGVAPECHRRGVGRRLLEHAERWLQAEGVHFLQVKTLSPSRESEHYRRTRRFYEAVGFTPLEEFPTLWDEANPCLQMIKSLDPPGA